MDYSETIMEFFHDPVNRETLNDADSIGISGTPGSGPFVVFQVMQCKGRIARAAFQCHNCGVAIACGSVLTVMVNGMKLEECLVISVSDLNAALNGIPVHKLHIAEFALQAMRHSVLGLLK